MVVFEVLNWVLYFCYAPDEITDYVSVLGILLQAEDLREG